MSSGSGPRLKAHAVLVRPGAQVSRLPRGHAGLVVQEEGPRGDGGQQARGLALATRRRLGRSSGMRRNKARPEEVF